MWVACYHVEKSVLRKNEEKRRYLVKQGRYGLIAELYIKVQE